MTEQIRRLGDLVFTSFGNQVFAMDRYTGELAWEWKSPEAGYPALLVDGDRLIVSFNGYTYCLDPVTGAEVWKNPLTGKGIGVPILASLRGGSTNSTVAEKAEMDAAAARNSSTHS
ncbi:MAG: PQQ-binding-like beta-propeller repeat protein [Planctomycetota bacterium]|nr:PQQ-binding-like beta-propeller repeat protein [Planctomycetota bacterium]